MIDYTGIDSIEFFFFLNLNKKESAQLIEFQTFD